MTDRTRKLRYQSLAAKPSISAERALLITQFYRRNVDSYSPPILRALAFRYLLEHKAVHIGDRELIIGERGPEPKATPTYPELTCHSEKDLEILNSREKTPYAISPGVFATYREEIIPFWKGTSLRDRIFNALPSEWHAAYSSGVFTEFMEQRAPGHTVADGKIYHKGMIDFKEAIHQSRARLDQVHDPDVHRKLEQLQAMEIAADALIRFARRHADEAERQLEGEADPARRSELQRIAEVCSRVPAQAPRTFREALQMYWFCHLGVITELNGWDAYSPGHLDQHLWPFYQREIEQGTITRESARELLECFFIKFNNHPAPPKVGVTAAESGTYTDFANINLAGQFSDGSDASNELSCLLLEIIDEMHLLQPSNNVQISRKTPDAFLKSALRVIRNGYGFPSVFNSDVVVEELVRQGKSLEDAREGGTSGCVEAGAFGKEAYILTGYFNLPKVLEITLHNGLDPRTGKLIGIDTGEVSTFTSFDDVFHAWEQQLGHFVDIKIRGNELIEQLYASSLPVPFLSLITDDCIETGKDYHAGGARYNTSYIQGVGIGTLTDSLAATQKHVFQREAFPLEALCSSLDADFKGNKPLRQQLLNKSPKWGNDDEEADDLMQRAFNAFLDAVDGRPNARGGTYHVDMLPTTCHVYFGSVTGATPDGRMAGRPLSEGISPSQGMDRKGPTAVLLSAAKMDHVRTGGTLLNMKFSPDILAGEDGIERLLHLIRTYFSLGGHHVQFNVVSAHTLRQAMEHPEEYRNLIVRVAGYSDYFCDLTSSLQEEIIARTEHAAL